MIELLQKHNDGLKWAQHNLKHLNATVEVLTTHIAQLENNTILQTAMTMCNFEGMNSHHFLEEAKQGLYAMLNGKLNPSIITIAALEKSIANLHFQLDQQVR